MSWGALGSSSWVAVCFATPAVPRPDIAELSVRDTFGPDAFEFWIDTVGAPLDGVDRHIL